MNLKNKLKLKQCLSLVLCSNMVIALTSCNETSKKLETMQPLSIAEVALKENNLSGISTEQAVYNYLSSTVNLKSDYLVKASESDIAKIEMTIGYLNEFLATGKSIENVLSDELANYILWEFCSRTPYTWEYTSSNVLGYDAATNLYFVDITYKTTKTKKAVLPTSKIVLGDTSYDSKMQRRYSDYINLLSEIYESLKDETNFGLQTPSQINVVTKAEDMEKDAKEDTEAEGVIEEIEDDIANNTTNTNSSTYLDYALQKYELPENLSSTLQNKVKAFENTWGTLSEVFSSQNYDTLLDKLLSCNVYNEKSIGQFAFPGLAETNSAVDSAELTFRLVLDYSYLWGTEQSLKVQTLYLKNYEVNNAETLIAGYTNENSTLLKNYTDFISDKIHSYLTSVNTINHYGLNKLYTNYSKFDAYYKYMGDTTYRSYKGFQKEILGLTTDNVAVVKVTSQYGLQGKGSEMSLPTYMKESLIFLELTSDEQILIKGELPLSDTLIGEPLSVVRNISGISEQLLYTMSGFTKDSEQGVMTALGSFAQLEMSGDITASSPYNVVDLGISTTAYNILQSNITDLQSLSLKESYTFIQSWVDKSNTYCVLKLREIYLGDTSYDTESTISLINSDDGWRVINYVRTKTNTFGGSSISAELSKNADFHVIKDGEDLKLEFKEGTFLSEDEENSENAENTEIVEENP